MKIFNRPWALIRKTAFLKNIFALNYGRIEGSIIRVSKEKKNIIDAYRGVSYKRGWSFSSAVSGMLI